MRRTLSAWRFASAGAAVLSGALLLGAAAVPESQQERPSEQQAPERFIAQVIRELQMDLEASSSAGVLGKIDSAKFEEYARFRDMIERLTREDTLRVFFRQLSIVVEGATARTILDAEMEMTRPDSALPAQRRQHRINMELERTDRGWKIVNLTPRNFFRPL